jgi:hypothetical protein
MFPVCLLKGGKSTFGVRNKWSDNLNFDEEGQILLLFMFCDAKWCEHLAKTGYYSNWYC